MAKDGTVPILTLVFGALFVLLTAIMQLHTLDYKLLEMVGANRRLQLVGWDSKVDRRTIISGL